MPNDEHSTREIGGVFFRLYGTKEKTVREACSRSREDHLTAYRSLTKDERPKRQIDEDKVARVIRIAVERAWHEDIRGAEPSVQLLDEFREACVEAVSEIAGERLSGLHPYRFEKDCAFDGIEAGLNSDELLSMIHEHFPGSKADKRRVSHYRWLYKQERGES